MSSFVLVARLVRADLRRHRVQGVLLLLAVAVATATLAVGVSLPGVSDSLYAQTRAATAGPDVVVLSGESGPAVAPALASLTEDPRVVAHRGPYRIVYGELSARDGITSPVVVHAIDERPAAVERPVVTSGEWVRPGGLVLERGFATALEVGPGDRVTIAGRTYPVVGVAVTAATSIYPWAAQIGPGGGPSDYSGLAWLTTSDARALAEARDLQVTTAVDLKLRDPATAGTFRDAHHELDAIRVNFHSWQFKAQQDMVILRNSQPVLVLGGWLLDLLAVTGVAALAAGRTAEQTRRAGLLKAVGATPGVIATVLLTEYLVLAVAGNALGLVAARLAMPVIATPTASRIGDVTLTGSAVVATAVLAVVVAVLSTLRPTLHALRTATVTALGAGVRRPRHRPWLTALSALLPTPLLLGLRLTARRPGRAVLQACATAVTVITLIALLALQAQHNRGYGLNGSSALPNLRGEHDRQVLLAVTVLIVVLAVVNTLILTWTTAMDARLNLAIAQAVGATPGQVAAGLSVAQLLPAVSGALAGVPLGTFMNLLFSARNAVAPPAWGLFAVAAAAVVVTAALVALPARLAARRPVAPTLSAEAA
ncbi:FtsX-like permease family protein [Nonomuraea sp. NPDC049419]|uniref:ABC transporter permease n=1 Tax=Nonomuraea sp. NPDC049419 TaxID=3155772 RepID=UPI0034349591